MSASATESRRQPDVQDPVVPVTPQDVLMLQSVRAFPSLSVLMSTTSGRMSLTEQTRLQDLVDAAILRLRKAPAARHSDRLIAGLHRLCRSACAERVDRGLGLFVGPQTQRAYRFGIPVSDRVVLDHTFATRDLVLSLQRTPRHLVLMLSSREARLLESINGQLQPAATHAFPYAAERPRRTSPSRPRLADADLADFLRTVDRRLGVYRALRPSPLVLVGPAPVVSSYTRLAKNAHRLAGTLTGNYLDANLTELSTVLQPVLRDYLASREQEALELLASRAAHGKVVSGMQRAWLATRAEEPEMLAVEQGLFYPARLSADGHTLTPSADLDDPEVIDDAVDELIEHVLIRGGWVAMTSDGDLSQHDGVALIVR